MVEGERAAFHVDAAGSSPADGPGLSYQWFLDGSLIETGFSADYDIEETKASDAGRYSVRVEGWLDAATSRDATLTVLLRPTVEIGLYAGIAVSGTVGQSYQIQYKSSANDPIWTSLTTIQLPRSPYLYIDDQAPIGTKRFYQAVLVRP